MRQKLLLAVTVIMLVLIVAVFFLLKSADLDISPVFLPHAMHAASQEGLAAEMGSAGNIISLRSPEKMSWKPGETGLFALGVKNSLPEERTFHINVKPERLDGKEVSNETNILGARWVIHPGKLTIPPGDVGVEEIIISPANPQEGTYLYRITVCETKDCQGLASPSVYGTVTFSFSIRR